MPKVHSTTTWQVYLALMFLRTSLEMPVRMTSFCSRAYAFSDIDCRLVIVPYLTSLLVLVQANSAFRGRFSVGKI